VSAPHTTSAPDAEESEGLSQRDRGFAEAEANIARREERRNPGTWLPGVDDLDSEPGPGDETGFSRDDFVGHGSRQLGLRLRPKHFDRLCQVAELYGVRPTTLARMMVIRGVNAVIEAENRRKAEMLGD
jgi:hypothetical protein